MPEHQDGSPEQGTKSICAWCVGNPWLTAQVEQQGHLGSCTYCFGRRRTVPLESLAGWTHQVISAHFVLTPNHPTEPDDFIIIAMGMDWERRGGSPTEIIAEEAGLVEEIANDILSLLSDLHTFDAVREGEEDPYDKYETRYEAVGPNPEIFWSLWNSVPNEIRHRARFFNADAERILGNIFGDLATLQTEHGTPVIRNLGSSGQDTFIWRARTALSRETAEYILESPAQELGPPPRENATAGRMNPEGIPVFYGAMDLTTCIAEIRPPVGSYVVAGRFKLLKAVRVLDMDLLQEAYAEPNYFDPQYVDLSNRIAFLKQLVAELARPVMPGDETKEYLATQIVAEYLAQKTSPRLDGILFRSSQMNVQDKSASSEESVEDRNIVLFNYASRVEPFMVPHGVTVEARLPLHNDEDDDEISTITVWEFVIADSQGQPEVATAPDIEALHHGSADAPQEDLPPSLQIDIDSIVVLDIHRMKPVYTKMSTERVRRNKCDIF